MTRLSESEWGQTQSLRRKLGAETEPELIFLLALDELLEQESNWLRGWEEHSQLTGFPRPPRRLEGKRRLHLLRHTLAPERLRQPSHRDFPSRTAARLEELRGAEPEQRGSWLARAGTDELSPSLVHLCCDEAAFLAVDDPAQAADLLRLADSLVQEMAERRHTSRAQIQALHAEIECADALVAAMRGQLDEAQRRLSRAEATLRTRRRLQCWGRSADGTVQPPRRVNVPIRSHAFWLSCSASVHAACGYLERARELWWDAAELYFDIGSFFASGLQYHHLAHLASWNNLPRQGAVQLECALQLLDLRSEPELRGRLSLELALLHLEAGNIVQGSQELELTRHASGCPRSGIEAAQGLLFQGMENSKPARLWLQRARASAANELAQGGPAGNDNPRKRLPRSVLALTLDLVEIEATMSWPRPDPARWLEDEVSLEHLEAAPPLLRERWVELGHQLRGNRYEAEDLQQLRADLDRWQHFSACPWQPARPGSLWLDAESPEPDAASLLVPTEIHPAPVAQEQDTATGPPLLDGNL